MRFVGFGQWLYFVWHLPALVLGLAAVAVSFACARSLWRDAHPARLQQTLWYVLAGSAMVASSLSVVVWPYLKAAASIEVTEDGTWHLSNYLGVPVAVIPGVELRRVLGEDLGGLRVGMGRITIVRSDGTAVSTVRLSGDTFERVRRALGYTDGMLRPSRGGVETLAHYYTHDGPTPQTTLAAR